MTEYEPGEGDRMSTNERTLQELVVDPVLRLQPVLILSQLVDVPVEGCSFRHRTLKLTWTVHHVDLTAIQAVILGLPGWVRPEPGPGLSGLVPAGFGAFSEVWDFWFSGRTGFNAQSFEYSADPRQHTGTLTVTLTKEEV